MPQSEVRIDKWLWAMRVFKTRTIATEAIKKGRVTMGDNPNPVKPSRTIKVGDTVSVRKPPITHLSRSMTCSTWSASQALSTGARVSDDRPNATAASSPNSQRASMTTDGISTSTTTILTT